MCSTAPAEALAADGVTPAARSRGSDHPVGAQGVGRPDDGAQVVGILHAVEQDEERGTLRSAAAAARSLVELPVAVVGDHRHDPLVLGHPGQPIEPGARRGADLGAALAGGPLQIGEGPGTLAPLGEPQLRSPPRRRSAGAPGPGSCRRRRAPGPHFTSMGTVTVFVWGTHQASLQMAKRICTATCCAPFAVGRDRDLEAGILGRRDRRRRRASTRPCRPSGRPTAPPCT